MKEKILDDALRQALAPQEEADVWLNQRILKRAEEKRTAGGRKSRLPAAVAAVLLLCAGSVTAYAAWKYLSPSDVAEEMQDAELAEVFQSAQATAVYETQSCEGYRVTLLGVVSGEGLSEYPRYQNGTLAQDRTYAVVAIEKEDGAPMPDISEEGYGELEFFVSPLIAGYDPALYNLASMSGNYMDMVQDGVLYRLVECDTVEIFADHEIYLCVTEGTFYPAEAYRYDRLTGEIGRNEDYEGLNALFGLPMDAAGADPQKAAEYIESLGLETDIPEEGWEVETDGAFEVEITEGHQKGAEVAEYALQFVGNPYSWGSDSLTDGTDSSGFTKSVYAYFGICIPHDSRGQREVGTKVDALDKAMPGDLIFYETPAHVAIYLGEGKIVHAMPEHGICISEAEFDDVSEIRRIRD